MRLERAAFEVLGQMPQRATGETPVEVVVAGIHLTGVRDVDGTFGRAGIVEDARGLDEQPPTRRKAARKDSQQTQWVASVLRPGQCRVPAPGSVAGA